MKDFFKWDEFTRDFLVMAGIVLAMYVSSHIAVINIETVASGSFLREVVIFLKNQSPFLYPIRDFFVAMKGVFVLMITLFFAGSVWFGFKTRDIHRIEDEKYSPIPVEEIEAKEKMVQWQVVLNHINSESPAEWKLGILEADNMLDEILAALGYQGESLGEKLKAMDASGFASYQDAWEAHKVRNQIAHEGAATMDFSKKMARDTLLKFEKVFKELKYI